MLEKKSFITGIDHIGINVPNIEAATTFLQDAFDAEIIYESYSKKQTPLGLEGVENTLNVDEGTRIHLCRMIKIGHGPNIELFEVHVKGQRQAVKSSDLGIQHFSLYTDNISKATEQFKLAGGKILSEPSPIMFPIEKGEGNLFCYGVTPWGTSVEFITYPDVMAYEEKTDLRRWKAGFYNK